jgi:hypothetical protein
MDSRGLARDQQRPRLLVGDLSKRRQILAEGLQRRAVAEGGVRAAL